MIAASATAQVDVRSVREQEGSDIRGTGQLRAADRVAARVEALASASSAKVQVSVSWS